MERMFLFILLVVVSGCRQGERVAVNTEPTTPTPRQASMFYGFNLDQYNVDTAKVKRDEGLIHILPRYGVSYNSIVNLVEEYKDTFNVRSIKTGDDYFLVSPKDTSSQERHFIYVKDPVEYVTMHFGDSLYLERHQKEIEIHEMEASGVITSSLWNSFQDQDLNLGLFAEVLRLFQWTIDFFDTKKGDSFKVIYDEKFVEGESVGIDKIKALVFNHKGKDYYAFRYEASQQDFVYYTEKGESLKRVLLSAPLVYRRISSRFSNRRFHPVLKYYRPHHGVDYAAPTGTEVVATGSGTVTFAGRSGGAGKMVKIKHNKGNIETRYLHLHRYGRGIRKGAKVSQGQKIGEVGSTGLSTGPHLDYRVYIKGKAVNPLGINIPTSDPLQGDSLSNYLDGIIEIRGQLDGIIHDTISIRRDTIAVPNT